ncbi:MAG: hypothetical protein M1822_004267 [Bathelium mastoideum]|nr:MAG: hypothetical protein M1822_004267 [Bathelium mastoideum]
MNIFECMPVGSGWERFNFQHPAKAKCTLATRAAGIGTVVPNPIFDAALILIPLPHIWHIQVPRAQRLALMAVFAVGIFVTCVASLRIYFIASLSVTSIDITWSLVNGVIWTIVEINTGIICACLPLLRPILNLMLFRKVDSTSPRTRGDKATALSWCRPARNNNTKLDSEDQEDLFRQNCQNCQADNDIHMQTNIERLPRTPEVEHDSIDIDHGIKVKTDIRVGHHKRDVSHT